MLRGPLFQTGIRFFATLLRRLTRRRGPCFTVEHLRLTLYTRKGCHLCDDAWNLLREEQERYRFAWTVVDVDSDPELAAQHGNCVPVVTVNDKVYFRGRVNRVLLTRIFRAEAARRVRDSAPDNGTA